jgi:lysozyme
MIQLAELSAALVGTFEGEKLVSYLDTGGIPTIAIGHTRGVKLGDVCTHAQALAWFAEDDEPLLIQVQVRPLLEAAALLSFGFNCGRGALAKVLAGTDTIANPVHTTDRTGRVLPGLVMRRRLEGALIQVSRESGWQPPAEMRT